MKFNILKLSYLIITSLIVSSCWSYSTTRDYSDDFRVGYSSSKPIYLALKDTEKNRIFFILERNINTDDFYIKVRWVYKNKVKQFKGYESILRFMVDKNYVISSTPIKPIRIVAYHLEPEGIEEEAVYKLTREEMQSLANAKSVIVELEGKTENKVGSFNSIHTFKAFREFMKNS